MSDFENRPRFDVNDWIEETIRDRFPDSLQISTGQLRVRIAILCDELAEKVERETERSIWETLRYAEKQAGKVKN